MLLLPPVNGLTLLPGTAAAAGRYWTATVNASESKIKVCRIYQGSNTASAPWNKGGATLLIPAPILLLEA
jgi:hypothetical protein